MQEKLKINVALKDKENKERRKQERKRTGKMEVLKKVNSGKIQR